MRTAFERLTISPTNLSTSSTTMTMMPGYTDNQIVDAAALHNMMQNCTDCRDLVSNRQNVKDWKIDAFLCNWRFSVPDAAGVMFDASGTRYDGIAREAAAIFWPVHDASFSTDPIRRGETALTLAHEVGHALNFLHEWSSCHGALGGTCNGGANAPTIMSYYSASDPTYPNIVRFNEENPPSPGGWDRNIKRFYHQGPEAWLKPGANGFKMVTSQTGIPTYITY